MMKPRFTRKSIHTYSMNRLRVIERILIRELIAMAEEAVNICRNLTPDDNSYTDQTGNLRSSIGFELFVNGVAYHEDFKASGTGTESGETGMFKGKELAEEIGPLGAFTLIFVAGMDYAEEVEMRGKLVLTPGYDYIEKQMPKVLDKVKELVARAA